MFNIRKLSLLFLFIVFFSAHCESLIDEHKMYVRLIYLVSNDKLPNDDFVKGIDSALKNIQTWYRSQLDGSTFILHPEGVRIFRADVEANYFKNNPNGADKAAWGVKNCEEVAKRVAGARFLDPTSIWVVYSDSTGWGGQGGSGFTCMPVDDLYGLIGKNRDNRNVNRWIGAAAHELGHAFGLSHSPNYIETNNALMAYGWFENYPTRTFLSNEEKAILSSSPFFYKDGQSVLGKIIDNFYYPTGWFELRENGQWYEFKYDNSFSAKFIIVSDNVDTITLFDDKRNLYLLVPKSDGMAYFSIGNKNDWKYAFKISR